LIQPFVMNPFNKNLDLSNGRKIDYIPKAMMSCKNCGCVREFLWRAICPKDGEYIAPKNYKKELQTNQGEQLSKNISKQPKQDNRVLGWFKPEEK